jgi:putative CocE/NonD family hydrolase
MSRQSLLLLAAAFAGACGTARAPTVARVSAPGAYEGYSAAEYDGYQRTSQYLTMRDGTRLAADILRPTKAGVVHIEKLPVVWTHHRYNRAFLKGDTIVDYAAGFGRGIDRLIHHGYVVAAVDTRGGGASFGTQPGFFAPDETKDAYEVTEWLAAQPWSTGSVGMTGRSYLGITQLFAATQAPPHLKAIFPEMYVFEWYPMIYPGGVYRDDFFTKWQFLTHNLDNAAKFTWGPLTFGGVAPVDGPQGMAQRDSAIAGHAVNRDMFTMWNGVPFRNSTDPVSGKEIHTERGPATYIVQINKSGIPVYGLAGWFDAFPRDAFLWFRNLKVPQKLIVGPWFHGGNEGFDLAVERHRWFDHWLKGVANGIDREPPIRYYVIDAPVGSEWRTATTWPIPEAVATDFFFRDGKAGSIASSNDGRLLQVAPVDRAASDTRVVDTTATLGPSNRWAATYGGPSGYPDLAPNDAKGFTFSTAPLASPVEVVGHPVIHLWVTSSTKDVDAMAYLEDVDSTGRSTYVTEGVLRASHRKLAAPPFENFGLPWPRSHKEDVVPLPTEPAELVFDLFPTAKRFQAGHRIRVTIQGADRQTHVAVPRRMPPKVSIYRDATRPSRIVLPIVPGK